MLISTRILFSWTINMQRTIYKYPLGVIPHGQCMNVPSWNPGDDKPSHIVKIGTDASNEVCVWIDHPYPVRGNSGYIQIEMHPTGMPFDNDGRTHIETVITPGGFVWHYYEVN